MQKTRYSLLLLALSTSSLLFSSCKKDEAAPSLYDRIGQVDGVTKIVDTMLTNVTADCQSTSPTMLRTHMPLLLAVAAGDQARLQHLRSESIDLLSSISGGPATYTGKSMMVAHAGMNITNSEFGSWRSLLSHSLDQCSVAATEKSEVLAKIDGMQTQVVGK